MSRFDVLAKRGAPESAPNEKTIARRGNPDFRQFSAYISVALYRRFKIRLVEIETELSVGVEEAIGDWLEKKQC